MPQASGTMPRKKGDAWQPARCCWRECCRKHVRGLRSSLGSIGCAHLAYYRATVVRGAAERERVATDAKLLPEQKHALTDHIPPTGFPTSTHQHSTGSQAAAFSLSAATSKQMAPQSSPSTGGGSPTRRTSPRRAAGTPKQQEEAKAAGNSSSSSSSSSNSSSSSHPPGDAEPVLSPVSVKQTAARKRGTWFWWCYIRPCRGVCVCESSALFFTSLPPTELSIQTCDRPAIERLTGDVAHTHNPP